MATASTLRVLTSTTTLLLLLAFRTAIAQQSLSPSIVERVREAVVTLRVFDDTGAEIAQGSGFILRDGRVATSSHVLAGANWVEVYNLEDQVLGTAPFVEVISHRMDLAILPRLADVKNGLDVSRSLPEVGQFVWVIGSPEGLSGSVSDGLVSAIRDVEGRQLIQLTAPVSPGSSGGPVLDQEGVVVGLVASTLPSGQNLNFAVPASQLAVLIYSPSGELAFPDAPPRTKAKGANVSDTDSETATAFLALLSNAGNLLPNRTIRGELDAYDVNYNGRFLDAFRLDGLRGDRLTINVWSDVFDTYLAIYAVVGDKAGEWTKENDDGGYGSDSRLLVTLPDDGTYVIIVGAAGYRLGAYAIEVTRRRSQ